MTDTVFGVLVTHRRPDELTKSLDALTTQSRALDHLIVVDNDDDERVRDLVAGSGLVFEDRGAAALKGLPGEWRLYAVSGEA